MHYLSREPKVDRADAIKILWEDMMQVSQAIGKLVMNLRQCHPRNHSH